MYVLSKSQALKGFSYARSYPPFNFITRITVIAHLKKLRHERLKGTLARSGC